MNTLQEALTDYLTLRRGLGFKLYEAGNGLSDFVSFLEKKGASYITISLTLEWAQLPLSAQPEWHARRLIFVRGFARYRRVTDPRTEIPPYGLLPYRCKRARPYIYTDQEIEQLLEAALNLQPVDGLRRWTYYCLLGLLSVSGLRISESIGLKTEDVDLTNGVLTVRSTKFGKSRLVPLHPTTQHILSNYKLRRDKFLNGRLTDFFFISKLGTRLGLRTVEETFSFLSCQVGLRGPGSSHRPRLHDFRHRFAIKTLLQWYSNGENVENQLPILSTYLGHSHIRDTYWYLTLCPELMEQVVKLLERRWEVSQDETNS